MGLIAAFGETARFHPVFHGGSGSELRDISRPWITAW
jgi:hypothetical protein